MTSGCEEEGRFAPLRIAREAVNAAFFLCGSEGDRHMATEAIGAQGTTLSVALNAGSPLDFTAIPECTTIPGPAEKAEKIDVSSLDSTGGYREFIQGFKTTDDIEVVMNYRPDDTTQAAFLALFDSGASRPMKVTYPDAATASFNAIVIGRGRSAQVGQALQIRATLSPTGVVTFVG